MLIQINNAPVQFYTSNPEDLKDITAPHTVKTQVTTHESLSHTFSNPENASNLTTSAPSSTKKSIVGTATYIVTMED